MHSIGRCEQLVTTNGAVSAGVSSCTGPELDGGQLQGAQAAHKRQQQQRACPQLQWCKLLSARISLLRTYAGELVDLAADLDGRSETDDKQRKSTIKRKATMTKSKTMTHKGSMRLQKETAATDTASKDPATDSSNSGDGFCRRLLQQVRECEEQIARGVGQSTRVFAADLEALEGSGHLRGDGPAVEMCGVEHWEQQLFEAQDGRFGALLQQQMLSLLNKLSPNDANELVSYVQSVCTVDGKALGGDSEELFFCCPDIEQISTASRAQRAHWKLKRQQRKQRRMSKLEEEERLQQELEASTAGEQGGRFRRSNVGGISGGTSLHQKSSSASTHHKSSLASIHKASLSSLHKKSPHKSSSASLLAPSASSRNSTSRGSTSLGSLRHGQSLDPLSSIQTNMHGSSSRGSLTSTRARVPRPRGRMAAVLLLAELVSELRAIGSAGVYATIGATLRRDGRLLVHRHFAEHVSVQRAAVAAYASRGAGMVLGEDISKLKGADEVVKGGRRLSHLLSCVQVEEVGLSTILSDISIVVHAQ
jgi:hypothetical protein